MGIADIDDEVRALRATAEAAAKASTRHEIELERSKAVLASGMQDLHTEFGISSLDEAKVVLDAMTAEVEGLTQQAQDQLRSATP